MSNTQTTDSPPAIEAPDDLQTAPEVARQLRVSRTFVYEETRAGRLPAIRLGRSVRYRRSDVQRYLTAHTQDGQP